MTTSNRWALGTAALACALAATSAASDADAQIIHRLYLHGELGLGAMVSDHASTALGYDSLGGELTLRAGLRVLGPLNVQLGFANWLWLRDQGSNGRLLSLEIGLRGIFPVGSLGSLWVDLNVGPGFSGDLVRLHGNVGLGFDFAVTRTLGVGPFARLGQLLQTTDPALSGGALDDATFFAVGVNATWHLPEAAPEPVVTVGDRDGDGVLDPDDQCVEVPQGPTPDPARRGCPEGDRDGDGVLDTQDLCPTFPRGDEPNPERLGCPDDDNDGDGVADHNDRCPLEPMDPRPDPDRLGCRRPETVINLGEILFETNSTAIVDNEQNNHTLSQAQGIFSAHEEINLFSIEGHTDERDSDRHNRELSRGRAESVRDWLVAHGIATARMVPAGYGEECPVDPAHTEAAWARNRRVVFVIARRNGAVEAGATFGCPAAAELIPEALGVTPAAPTGRHGRHGRHGHHGGGHRSHRRPRSSGGGAP